MQVSRKKIARQPQSKPAAGHASPPSRHWLAAGLLSAVTAPAFSNSFGAGFVFDSKPILLEDPRIRQVTAQNIALIWQHTYWWPSGEAGLYRPFTTFSYLFNYAILGNGRNPAGYHLLNLLLHLANVLLVYALAHRLVRRFWPSVFIAGIWAVHPLLTESVTNLVGRADLLAGTAVLGGFWIYLKSAETRGGRRLAWLVALALAATAGFFAKESAVVLVGAIFLFEFAWWKERKQARAPALASIALAAPLAALLYQRAAVLAASPKADFPFTDNPIIGAGFWAAKLTALKVLARYLWLTVWPAKLSADYSYSEIRIATGTLGDWVAWIAVAAAAAGVLYLYRVSRTGFFFACFAFLTLLPASNLFFPIGSIMAERFMYLPLTGLAGCAVLGIYKVAERSGNARLAPALLLLIGAAFALRTRARNLDWHDDVSLDTAAVADAPRSFKTHKMLAVSLMESDSGDARLDQEIGEAQKSMAIVNALPDTRNDPSIYRLAANLYLRKGDLLASRDSRGRAVNPAAGSGAYRDALAALQRNIAILRAIVRQNPAAGQGGGKAAPEFVNSETGRLLSVIYERLGEHENALRVAIQARNADPLNPLLYRQLANVFLDEGNPNDAAEALLEGMLVTQDLEVRGQLIQLYQGGLDSKGCALVNGPNGPAINPSCALIHEHLCAVSADSVKVRLATGRRDIARQMRDSFLRDYGCPAGPLDEAMAEKPGS